MKHRMFAYCLALLFSTEQVLPVAVFLMLGTALPALAQDDDDGDDDDDDDDGDDGARSSGRDDDDDDDDDDDRRVTRPSGASGNPLRELRDLFIPGPRRQAAPAPAPAASTPVPLQDSAPGEIVALALSDDDLTTLNAEGFEVIEERQLSAFTTVSRRLRVPTGLSLTEARAAVRALPSGQNADFNHYYRSEQGFSETCRGTECPARLSIGWPLLPDRETSCGRGVTIGMIDTGINDDHAAFAGARLEVHRLTPEDFDPSQAIHGTAVAALLVGDPATRSPGLVPAARLIAVDAFHRRGSDERADIFTLVEALDFLADQGVEVVNLSLAGPENAVLAEAVDRLVMEKDIVIVSAVGNDGPRAEPTFPAAYEPVIAVTAVDRDGNVYRRAVQGAHVDLAAPGVNVWTAASISGARHKTGTSFAVPFVAAAAAILRDEQPDLSATEVAETLRSRAVDLGDNGPDAVFGAGLLNLDASCLDRT